MKQNSRSDKKMIDDFLAFLRVRNRSLHTISAYEGDLRLFAERMGFFSPADIKRVRDFISACHEAGERAVTIGRRLAALRTFFEWAKDRL